jgi:opacity protein-like surface antigen
MSRAIGILVFLTLFRSPIAAAQWERAWVATSGLGLQVRGGAGEIGRQPNATGGHEDLIARLDGGLALAAHAGFESRLGGVELRLSWGGSAVEVVNVYGARFPNHGEPPIVWSGNILVYPFAVVARPGRLQPFLVAGGGGMLIQVDLDNIKGQTLYNRFQWTVGAGLRIVNGLESPMMTTTYVELRIEQQTTWQDAPFQRFRTGSVTVALGMRF